MDDTFLKLSSLTVFQPIILLRFHQSEVFRFYRAADVCYVSSLHDGMNLVAKEFVAAHEARIRPLEKDVEGGRFRADLLARLGHLITVPPLRERPDDVPLLVEHFRRRYDREDKRFSDDALAMLRAYSWPFNVRELQQVVERAVCLVDHAVIGPEDLPDHIRPGVTAAGALAAGPPGPLGEVVAEAERRHVLRALEYTRGNRRKAMELLGISPETFYRRLEEYGLHKKGSA
jgi:DNA-binding NtrC family response regulator